MKVSCFEQCLAHSKHYICVYNYYYPVDVKTRTGAQVSWYHVIFTAFCYSEIYKRTLEKKKGGDKQMSGPTCLVPLALRNPAPRGPLLLKMCSWARAGGAGSLWPAMSLFGENSHDPFSQVSLSAEQPCLSLPLLRSLGPGVKLHLEGKFPSSTYWLDSSQ